jgi:hypothetical protein
MGRRIRIFMSKKSRYINIGGVNNGFFRQTIWVTNEGGSYNDK